MEANEIRAALDSTLASLQSGVQRLGIEAALPVIEGWEGRLAASGDPELEPVAENLGALRGQLSADDCDKATVGLLLSYLEIKSRD